MPAPPELYDISRLVRRIKIEGQFKAKTSRSSHRHIAVAAEVKIKLQRIGKHDDQRIPRMQRGKIGISIVRRLAKRIRDQHLLCKSQSKQGKTSEHSLPVIFSVHDRSDPGKHFIRQCNGAFHQLGEESNIHAVVQSTHFPQGSPVALHQKSNLTEGKKADGQRHIGSACVFEAE